MKPLAATILEFRTSMGFSLSLKAPCLEPDGVLAGGAETVDVAMIGYLMEDEMRRIFLSFLPYRLLSTMGRERKKKKGKGGEKGRERERKRGEKK